MAVLLLVELGKKEVDTASRCFLYARAQDGTERYRHYMGKSDDLPDGYKKALKSETPIIDKLIIRDIHKLEKLGTGSNRK